MNLNKILHVYCPSALILSMFLTPSCTASRRSSTRETLQDKMISKDATEPYFRTDAILGDDRVFSENIKTVLFYKKDWPLSDPFITFNSSEQLEFHFDVLTNTTQTLQYRIVHFNRNWQKSSLNEMDFIDGFNDNYFENHRLSFNTQQPYVHYDLLIPNENIRLKASGNYLIIVYPENHPESPLLTKRFYVTENKALINKRIKRASNPSERNYRQEIDIEVIYNPLLFINPFSNFHLIINQNHIEQTAFKNFPPKFIREDRIIYDYDEENNFDGNNEFRHIDLTTLLNATERTSGIIKKNGQLFADLNFDQKRSFKNYLFYQDIDGRMLIRTQEGNDPHTEADYVNVKFTLPYHEPLKDGDLYVYGQLSDWQFPSSHRLKYNYEVKAYQTTLLLKQGYYNYNYVFMNDSLRGPDMSFIEGTHFDTENEYIFKVYYTDPSAFYDRLLHYSVSKSNED